MKISIVMPPLGSKLSLKKALLNIGKLAEMGYDGVELGIRNPNNIDAKSIKKLFSKYNLELPAIGTGQAYTKDGLSFSDKRKDIRKKAVQRIKSQIRFASHFDAYVVIGLIRGNPQNFQNSQSIAQAEKLTMECLSECASYAKDFNIKLIFEPINRYEINFINTVDEGINFIKKLKHHGRNIGRNVGLLVDTFHMNIEEPSIEESIIKAKKFINHVHVADSNRWPPGFGHINFKRVMAALHKINYKGFLSAEIIPKPKPSSCVELTAKYLKKLIRK